MLVMISGPKIISRTSKVDETNYLNHFCNLLHFRISYGQVCENTKILNVQQCIKISKRWFLAMITKKQTEKLFDFLEKQTVAHIKSW